MKGDEPVFTIWAIIILVAIFYGLDNMKGVYVTLYGEEYHDLKYTEGYYDGYLDGMNDMLDLLKGTKTENEVLCDRMPHKVLDKFNISCGSDKGIFSFNGIGSPRTAHFDNDTVWIKPATREKPLILPNISCLCLGLHPCTFNKQQWDDMLNCKLDCDNVCG